VIDDDRATSPQQREEAVRRGTRAVWFAMLLPPSVTLLHLQFSYMLNHIACDVRSKIGLHVLTLGCLVLVAIAGGFATREWKAFGSESPGEDSGPFGSRRLMALLGMIGAGIFAYVIIAQWLPNAMLPACVRS
jgi:hypothetical protein